MRQENIPLSLVSGTASAAIPSTQLLTCSAQINAPAAGTMVLQASNDHTKPTNWSTVATVSVTAAGVFMIPTTSICYEYIRLLYTGSGTGTAVLVAQGQ